MIKILPRKKKGLFIGIIILAVILATQYLFASLQHDNKEETQFAEQQDAEEWSETIEKEEFNAAENIIEHIIDSHTWHIATINHTHIYIPLPVILIHNGKIYSFWSSKLHNKNKTHKNFKLETEGEYKGKIVHYPEYNYLDEEIVAIEKEEGEKTYTLPLDLSITKNVAAIFISIIIICWMFISIARAYNKRKGKAPKGLQSLVEPIIIFIRDDVAKAAIGEDKYKKYLPFLLTLFFFIFLNNLLGIVPFFPGGTNTTGNIGVTGVLALFTFIITSVNANKNYWRHIFNTPGVPIWLKLPLPIMPVVELLGIFTKPFVLMVRLFANITAGHIIILGFISLIFIFGNIQQTLGYGVSVVSVIFAVFIGLLELLVALIQAYVFTLLSALYFGMATEEDH